jgi:hypothetical protein
MSSSEVDSRADYQSSKRPAVKKDLSVFESVSCDFFIQEKMPGSGKYAVLDNNMWCELLYQLKVRFKHLMTMTMHHRHSTLMEGLSVEKDSVDYVFDRLISCVAQLNNLTSKRLSHTSARHAYRLMIQEYYFLRISLTWCSARNDQSWCVMFFDQVENNSAAANYDRYRVSQLRKVESKLSLSFDSDTEKNDMLLALSGQEAYTIVESFLLGSVFQEGARVVTSPDIYFEAFEQLEKLKYIELIRLPSWCIDDLIELVDSSDAAFVFIDPSVNNETLNIYDLQILANKLDRKDWSKNWLLIDGTMVSGGIDVFSIFSADNHPTILYYESGSKYLQFGLNMQVPGIAVTPDAHRAQLSISLKSMGGVVYPSAESKLPEYSRSMYLDRMRLLSNSAELFVNVLGAQSYLKGHINIAYPLKWRELGWDHGGNVVSIFMKSSELNDLVFLEKYIDVLLHYCREANIPITKGVNYGYSTTRVAATAMAVDMPAYLRFSIGEEEPFLLKRLIGTVVHTLRLYISGFETPHQLATLVLEDA